MRAPLCPNHQPQRWVHRGSAKYTSDVWNGAAQGAGFFSTGLGLSFYVSSPRSHVLILVRGCWNVVSDATNAPGGYTQLSTIQVDGGGYPWMAGCLVEPSGDIENPMSGGGMYGLTGLATGTHTVVIWGWQSTNVGGVLYLRPGSYPQYEGIEVQAIEGMF